jgi:hypothetical protein
MMPFTDTAVPDVDIAGGRIVVDAELFASAAAPTNTAKRRADER